MSLDNIQLPPVTITGLFRKSLVELKSPQAAENPSTITSINILGKNLKRVLVIAR